MIAIQWTRKTGWALLGVLALLFLTVLYLVTDAALDKGVGIWARLFLLTLGLAMIAASFFAARDVLKVRRARSLARPAPVAAISVAIVALIATMTDALSLLEPRPAIESEAGAIEGGVNQLKTDVSTILKRVAPPAPSTPRIVQRVAGLWGEPGCESVYRFALQDRALVVDWEVRPRGVQPYRMVATVVESEGDVLHVQGEEPARARGHAATFTYFTNGLTERLTWDDQSSPVPLELDRCS